MRELVVPPAAERDPNSFETVRAWVAENGLHCTINVGVWDAHSVPEERAWGIMLADVVRHLANALHERHGKETEETKVQVVRALLGELRLPTSEAHGKFWDH